MGDAPSLEQRFVFHSIAERYDRARPTYPEPLIDAALALAELPARGLILEIGCGTGQATRSLARRGHALVALEPGSDLAALARKHLAAYPDVAILETTFEDWPLEPARFDLVLAAQSFHWIDADRRFTKAADALRPGGALAVIGNATEPDTSPLRAALDAAYAEHAPSLAGASPMSWYDAEGPLPRLFAESVRFAPAVHRSVPWSMRFRAEEYVALLGTYSDHLMLPPAQRSALFAAVSDSIERAGGEFCITYRANLHLARRR